MQHVSGLSVSCEYAKAVYIWYFPLERLLKSFCCGDHGMRSIQTDGAKMNSLIDLYSNTVQFVMDIS